MKRERGKKKAQRKKSDEDTMRSRAYPKRHDMKKQKRTTQREGEETNIGLNSSRVKREKAIGKTVSGKRKSIRQSGVAGREF